MGGGIEFQNLEKIRFGRWTLAVDLTASRGKRRRFWCKCTMHDTDDMQSSQTTTAFRPDDAPFSAASKSGNAQTTDLGHE